MNKTFSNKEIIDMIVILEKYSDKKLPQKINFAIMKNIYNLNKELQPYNSSIQNLLKQFNNAIKKDENENIITNENGFPIASNNDIQNEINSQIIELINIKVDVIMYYVDIEVFNYDDKGIYDILTTKDIIILSNIICK